MWATGELGFLMLGPLMQVFSIGWQDIQYHLCCVNIT